MSGITAVAGMSGIRVSIADETVSKFNFGSTATATYRLGADGKIYDRENAGPFVEIGQWVTPAAAVFAANYEARATVTSGSLTSGVTGSWVLLTSNTDWTLSRASMGLETAVFTLEIRHAVSGAVVDTATITLEAEYA